VALWWAAVVSLADHPALAGAGQGTAPVVGGAAHEDGSATPAQGGQPRAIRSARPERRAAGAGALLVVPSMDLRPAYLDGERAAPDDPPARRPALVSSVTRAPRAPPRP
jgi:hypothetical protein